MQRRSEEARDGTVRMSDTKARACVRFTCVRECRFVHLSELLHLAARANVSA